VLILICNVFVPKQIALDTSYWTVFNHIVIWGSVAFYFAMTLFINSNLIGNQYLGCLRMTLSSGQFWFTLFLVLAVLLVPVVANRFYHTAVNPTLSDRCRFKQRISRLRARPTEPQMRRRSSIRRSRRSLRSGYAFAHQEGFGRLIMSGKIMKNKTKSNINANNLNVPNTVEPPGSMTFSSSPRQPRTGIIKSTTRVQPVPFNTPSSIEI